MFIFDLQQFFPSPDFLTLFHKQKCRGKVSNLYLESHWCISFYETSVGRSSLPTLAAFSKRVKLRKKVRLTSPVGPLRCFAMSRLIARTSGFCAGFSSSSPLFSASAL